MDNEPPKNSLPSFHTPIEKPKVKETVEEPKKELKAQEIEEEKNEKDLNEVKALKEAARRVVQNSAKKIQNHKREISNPQELI